MKKPSFSKFSILLAMFVSMQVVAEDAEETFAKARDYTVRINATISRPFVEDDQGAYFGAGFMVDSDRQWIMTSAHVVGHSPATLNVITEDGSRIAARKVYVDPYVDVAIIELEERSPSIREAELDCDLEPGTGHPVGAYGHPWGLNFTGTQGVISGRSSVFGPKQLQTDTPINGGNSGGPLISMKTGKVVGVNKGSLDSDEDQNTNFAVPISQACQILSLLRKKIDPSPPQLSVTFYSLIGDNNPLIVARSFLDKDLIQLQEGDEILTANDEAVESQSDLIQALRGRLDDVRLVVRRADQEIELQGRFNPIPSIIDRKGLYFSGLIFGDAGFRDSDTLGIGHDVMIHSIETGSDANSKRLWEYDYVARVNNTPIRNLEHLSAILTDVLGESREITIDFLRIVEDGDSGQLFRSIRRSFTWTEPTYLGVWDPIAGDEFQAKETL